ncbi:unnamed protein product [Microthlaspi erraticum]|uniref:Uncharacterized protein n=1 Tax=Microthlaspi erraticum TaxID=1685480 RepID=A0A6D2L0W9_9BRAS|nr:unnamed protein product [Microthlaspi erraticum]
MKLNDALPNITVDPETYVVTANDKYHLRTKSKNTQIPRVKSPQADHVFVSEEAEEAVTAAIRHDIITFSIRQDIITCLIEEVMISCLIAAVTASLASSETKT